MQRSRLSVAVGLELYTFKQCKNLLASWRLGKIRENGRTLNVASETHETFLDKARSLIREIVKMNVKVFRNSSVPF